jgi:putative ABC transport system permease protein
MNLATLIKESLGNLFSAKLRSILTLLGVLIGTASVVALVSSGQLATAHALAQFKTLGTDLLAVTMNPSSSDPNQASQQQITLDKLPIIRGASPDIEEMAPYTNYYSPITYEGSQIEGGIIGASQTLQEIIKIPVAVGRFVSYLDKNAFYTVIGNNVADKMKAAGALDPIGKQIRVGNNVYTVIGVAAPWPENIFMFADIDNSLIIPIQNSFLLSKYVQLQNIIFRLKPNADIDKVQNQITQAINKVSPGQQLFFRSAKQLIASMQKQRETLTLLLSLIGGISLLVGGIGVMNIMLVSVTERRREIGIRMAVGATGKNIAMMFITEAVTLTVIGGLLGILIGELISFVAAELSKWGFQFFILPPVIGFLVAALVGIFFGFYPAYKASQLDPIQTLRSE